MHKVLFEGKCGTRFCRGSLQKITKILDMNHHKVLLYGNICLWTLVNDIGRCHTEVADIIEKVEITGLMPFEISVHFWGEVTSLVNCFGNLDSYRNCCCQYDF